MYEWPQERSERTNGGVCVECKCEFKDKDEVIEVVDIFVHAVCVGFFTWRGRL